MSYTLAERAEISAAQAEQHDPRNPGAGALWQRAHVYALLALIPHRSSYRVDRDAFIGHPRSLPVAVEKLLPKQPRPRAPRSLDQVKP